MSKRLTKRLCAVIYFDSMSICYLQTVKTEFYQTGSPLCYMMIWRQLDFLTWLTTVGVVNQDSANPKYLHLVLSQSMHGSQPLTLGAVCFTIPLARVGITRSKIAKGALSTYSVVSILSNCPALQIMV